MADFTWTDVLQNPAQFPDAMEIDMGEGHGRVRLGDLRATVGRQANQWRQQAEAYAAEKTALEEKLAYALAHPLPGEQPQGQQQQQQQMIDYASDPILRPLFQAAMDAQQKASRTEGQLGQLMKLQQQLMQNLGQIPGMMRIEQLKSADPGLDPAALIEFMQAKRNQPVDVADFYKLMTYEQQLQKAKEAGKLEGKTEAEQEFQRTPQVPYAPYGPAQTMAIPAPSHASLDEAENAIPFDADMIRVFQGFA